VVRAFERLHPSDGFTFRIDSRIPTSGGLGSSAAAIVAGLMAADHMFELDADVRSLATELEGHPDNVAAALDGGFVISAAGRTWRIDVPLGLEAVLVVPEEPVPTAQARAALPELVPRADAVFNVGAASLLTLGLATGDWEAVSGALHDRLHQPYRAHLYPRSAELLDRAMALGALGATISGAGPTVLVWSQFDQTGALVERLRSETRDWARVMRVPFESQGADVRGL
jgi:homoserine kinase